MECPHFGRLLDFPGECTLCSGAEKLLKKQQQYASNISTFVAKFPGHCSECNLPIAVGQLIAWERGMPVTHAECCDEANDYYEDQS